MEVGADAAWRLRLVLEILRRGALAGSLVLAASLALVGAAEAARLVSATGSQLDGYGRILLTFDAPVQVDAKRAGAVLLITFGEKVSPGPERIAAGMPDYVSVVRRDPDGTGLRLALQTSYRVNVQGAGEKVFVDLLPESWSGLPPPLPAEVVAELARRARAAEAALKARNPPPVAVTLLLELASTGNRTRLSLRLPSEARPSLERDGPSTRLTLPGAWRIDDLSVRGRLASEIGSAVVDNSAAGARLLATPAGGFYIDADQDGDAVTIDFLKTPPPQLDAKADAKPDAKAAAKPGAGAEAPAEAGPGAGTEPKPAAAAAKASGPADRPASPEPAPRRAGNGMVFPFKARPPAALFERAGIATLVFETGETVTAPPPGASGLSPLEPPRMVGGFAVLRFSVPEGRLVDLLPVTEPTGWELVAGDGVVPSDSLVAQRVPGAGGRIGIDVALPGPAGAVWLDLDGERVAVVTASGAPRAGVSKPQRFVEFELLTSRLGVAVLALADDLQVRPDLDGVAIGREAGMALSGVARTPEPPVGAVGDLVIEREAWQAAQRGDVQERLRGAFRTAVDATRGTRGPARVALARIMMAAGLDHDALAVLEAAAADDPVVESDPQVALMRGIALARIGRSDEAEKMLSLESLGRNAEARLWRGYAHALAGRWIPAEAGLRAGEAVLARYPEDVSATLQAALAETAVELADWDAAIRAAKAATEGASPLVRDRLALLRARIDEAKGGSDAALEVYAALNERGERPVAAAAALRETLLLHATRRIAQAQAIERLEVLGMTWHGGPTELAVLTALGRLYEQAGNWRKAFSTARRADAIAPDAPSTRALHDSAKALFEDLFLGERAGRLGGVEALALYFDFKDFAPAGRRADEIVRRLVDRLVELDLLDSADELLSHQIEHRLTGPARSSVAARLAAIRLMEGKPLEALQSLDSTYLPELGADLRRARTLLRARALSDLTRTDLALETVEGESGPDVDRLRADILWGARRWREAGEAHEALLGEVWRGRKPLDDAARADVVRAAIAYGLSGEAMGLERLKAKFAPAMAESADARTFALLTRPNAVRGPEFREIARRATTAETLAAFLAEYRKRYPQDAVPERGKAESRAETGAPPPG